MASHDTSFNNYQIDSVGPLNGTLEISHSDTSDSDVDPLSSVIEDEYDGANFHGNQDMATLGVDEHVAQEAHARQVDQDELVDLTRTSSAVALVSCKT